jgi:hypothetical protein
LFGQPRAIERTEPGISAWHLDRHLVRGAPGGRLITHFHASNFKLPDS